MNSNAKITILGNLVRDPILQQVGASDVCNFTVAVNTSKKEDGTGYNANFYDCSLWNEQGRYFYGKLQKGTQVLAMGDLEVVSRKNQAEESVSRLRVEVNDIRALRGLRDRTGSQADTARTEESFDKTEDITE